MKKRSNSRSTAVDKVVHNEAEFIDQVIKPNSPVNNGDDSGYGEKERFNRMKSFSCEDLLAVGSCSQNKRRQSSANETRINTKSTSSSSTSSSTSEEQISQCRIRSRLCNVSIDGTGRCQLVGDEYNNEVIYENEPVKRRTKTSVHLKVHVKPYKAV